MVVGTLSTCERYYVFGERFQKAFEFLKKNDINKMEPGRHEIDGDDVFAYVQQYDSKSIDNCGFEQHKVYADVHFVANGFEYLGYGPIERAGKPITEYDPVADAIFFEKECEYVLLQTGDIAIVFPEDVHMPQKRALVEVPVRKVCIKVRVD
ncbi:MAG: YhcH/YjgK/YiaL family protein [Oscillospiraceae bacterium]|nr:YhcH/YjgK/YiaL family protein [Oscillospiraceae bacterium]